MTRGKLSRVPVRRNLALAAIALAAGVTGALPTAGAETKRETVHFESFRYTGDDRVFAAPLAAGEYRNPVVAGFFPDPSIVRRDDDYYMVHSSFTYTPGLPILHSRNLVDWRLLGHALTRRSQINLDGQQVSRGIFAPTIRYHDGLFYIISTAVDAGGNFYVTAENPAGPWSQPVWLPEIDGIDPDLFFDDDGRAWLAHNGPPAGEPLYDGHRAIWLWEFDVAAGGVVPSSGRVIVNGGTDLARQPIWIEAPHIYRKAGWYYLLCAEGGTGYNHSAVVFRSRSVEGPYLPFRGNPILTQRDLDIDRPDPVTTAGHADFVQTAAGDWWAVFLATRTYDRTYYNTGRETFVLPVRWQDGWPLILDAGLPIPYRVRGPAISQETPAAAPLTGNYTWTDDFDDPTLDLHWNMLRGFDRDGITVGDGRLGLRASAVSMADYGQPAYLGRRQQHQRFRAALTLELPEADRLSAGLVVFQSETYHYYSGVRRSADGFELFLEQADGGAPARIRSKLMRGRPGDNVVLHVEADAGVIGFGWSHEDGPRMPLAENLDGKILSTEVAGGFVGVTLGPHARLEQH